MKDDQRTNNLEEIASASIKSSELKLANLEKLPVQPQVYQ